MSGPQDQEHRATSASTTDGLPVAPSMGPGLESIGTQRSSAAVDGRVLRITVFAGIIAVFAAMVAQLLTAGIHGLTQLAFFGRWSLEAASPVDHQLGWWVVLIPVGGAFIIGLMARYGSRAIRGHGIPEAMETVLFKESRIPARVLFLKPLSSVISIGTGGPFGAEGPIIATGGALGSLFGQYASISAEERKTLLAAGAAAGMAATFGAPVSAVLLSIELLLFEYRARSVIPVALASVIATTVRVVFEGTDPAFMVEALPAPEPSALLAYVLLGGMLGVASVLVTKAVYGMEDLFEHLPIHWMWWPMLGAIPVGIIGVFAPGTLGVGYENLTAMISGDLSGTALYVLCGWKLVSWLFALSSGTSGGTLAPLFTVGGGLGAAIATGFTLVAPSLGVDPRLGALVGMASIFAGASRAMLASTVFAFEATRQTVSLLPLLGGCTAAYLVSCVLMRNSIMTEKIARRGRPVPADYAADQLEQVLVGDVALRPVSTLRADQTLAEVRAWFASRATGSTHQGYPLVDAEGRLLAVLMRSDLLITSHPEDTPIRALIQREARVVAPTVSLRQAADLMVVERIGRLPVVKEGVLVGIVTRSDLLSAHRPRLIREHQVRQTRAFPLMRASGDGRD